MRLTDLKNIINQLPFNIVGNESPSQSLSVFFRFLVNNNFILDNSKFRFLMSGFAKIDTSAISSGASILSDWPTVPLETFNYLDLEDQLQDSIVSLYVRCLDLIDDTCRINFQNRTHIKERATNIFTNHLRSIINVSIEISNSDLVKEIDVKFSKRNNTLAFVIPKTFYKKDLITDTLNILPQNDRYISKVDNSQYTVHANNEDKDHDKILRMMFSDQIIAKAGEFNDKQILKPNPEIYNLIKLKEGKNSFKKLVKVAIAASIFCKVLDTKVYFILSSANTFYDDNFTLGSLAVGVTNMKPLTAEELSFFNIISNHISSVLSSQYIFETSQEIKLKRQRSEQKEFLSKFYNILQGHQGQGSDISHAQRDIENWHIDQVNNLLSNYQSDLIFLGLNSFVLLIKDLFIEGNTIDYSLFTQIRRPDIDSIKKLSQKSCLFKNSRLSNFDESNFRAYNQVQFNFSFLGFHNAALAHSLAAKLDEDSNSLLVVCIEDTTEIRIYAELKKEVNLYALGNKITNKTLRKGNFSSFVASNLLDFVVAGDFCIYSLSSKKIDSYEQLTNLELTKKDLLFSIRENFMVEYDQALRSPKIYIKRKPENVTVDTLIYTINYKR